MIYPAKEYFRKKIGRNGAGPLHYVTLYASTSTDAQCDQLVAFLRLLLQKGLSPNTTNDNMCTALHFVPFIKQEGTKAAMTALLLPRMTDAALEIGGVSSLWSGRATFDELSAIEFHSRRERRPLSSDVSRDLSTVAFAPPDYAALIRLTISNDIGGCVQWIADHGDVDGLDAPCSADGDGQGSSALHHACSRGHREIAELLLRSGASANVTNNNGCTPLHYAVFAQHHTILRLLLEHGAGASSSLKGESRLWDSPLTPAELSTLLVELTQKRARDIEAELHNICT